MKICKILVRTPKVFLKNDFTLKSYGNADEHELNVKNLRAGPLCRTRQNRVRNAVSERSGVRVRPTMVNTR